jgi:hypothetical protein
VGLPARIATVDANEGLTHKSHFQITEVYTNEWMAVDACNDKGPMRRSELGNIEMYSEAKNDDIFGAKSNWDKNYIGDWWRGPWW